MVQSRPVTTAAARADETEWTRANLAEVLPDLTSPQALSAFEDLLNRAERRYLGKLMAPEAELGPMVKSFCGRLYFNLSQMRHVCALGGRWRRRRCCGRWATPTRFSRATKRRLRLPIARAAVVRSLISLRILWQHLRAAHIVRAARGEDPRAAALAWLAADPRRFRIASCGRVVEEWRREQPD